MRRTSLISTAAGLCAALALGLAAPAPAAANNDAWENAEPIGLDDYRDVDTSGYGIDAQEPLTVNDSNQRGCTFDGQAGADGARMGATAWYSLVGDGSLVTITALGEFDTVAAVYEEQTFLTCNDDISAQRTGSELRLQTVAGHVYRVQVGGACFEPTVPCGDPPRGSASVFTSTPPANDFIEDAQPVDTGAQVNASNMGATEEDGEPLQCDAGNGSVSPMGKTVWFLWHAPEGGTATFQAVARYFDTVLAVYAVASGEQVGCNDDGTTVAGPSRLVADVAAGDYLIQVGGYGSYVAAADGSFVLNVEFTPTPPPPPPPPTPTPTPEPTSTPQPPSPPLQPASVERITSTVSTRWGRARRFVLLMRLIVNDVPDGARVTVTCKGRGCPFKSRTFARGRNGSVNAGKPFKRKRLRKGVVVQVRITKPGAIGRVLTYSLKKIRVPKPAIGCLPVGSTKPSKTC